MRPSLAVKFLLTIALTFGLIVGYFVWWWYPSEQRHALDAFIESTHHQLLITSEAIKPYLLQNQLAALYEVLGTLLEQNGTWLELELYGEAGTRIFPLEAGARPVYRNKVDTLDQSIRFRGEEIGRMRLVVDSGREMEKLHVRHGQLVWTIVAAIGMFALVIMALLEHLIRRPLGGLVRAANEMARGNFESRLPRARQDEIGDLVQDFSTMRSSISRHQQLLEQNKEAAEAANHAKSVFLAHMSHELRTPLNSILGFAQVLERSRRHPLSGKQKEQVGWITGAGKHLLELIDEVLDLAKIESGELQLSMEEVDVRSVMEECIRLTQTLAHNRGVTIEFRLPEGDEREACCRADHRRVKQAVLNLVSNAVKYNRQGGRVTLEYRHTEYGVLRILVRDDGPGIPQQRQGELFRPFNRLGAEASEVEGTGIGLLLTKRIVESMDGRVGFSSEEGHGSTFWIDLPRSECPAGEIVPTATGVTEQDGAVGGGHRVLYVEDNPINLRLVEDILNEVSDMRLISAGMAETGLELAITERPDLIIMDINLPGMSGLEAMSRLKGQEETRQIPVIALSANAMRGAREEALKYGFREYLTKPVDVERLMGVVEGILRSAGGSRPV